MARIANTRQEQEAFVATSPVPVSAPPTAAPVPAPPTVPVMTGTHFHALDEKGRVIIPAKLRPALTEQFWMILDENDNVGVYNYQTGLDVLHHCEQMLAEYAGDEEIAAAVERITGAADLVTVENGWRVQIPEVLRFYTGLDKEVVTVGVLNHAAIWNRQKWEEAQAQRLQSAGVKKAQAEMLRRAASGFRRPEPQQQVVEEFVQNETVAVPSGVASAGGSAGGFVPGAEGTRAASTPAGDGKRSPRVLTLSQLGR